MNYARNLSFLFVLMLTGCATKEFIALPDDMQNHINSTEAYVKHCPEKMVADVKKSNISVYTSGGLIPALIDSAVEAYRENNAQEAMKDIQTELKNYPYLQEKFTNEFNQVLNQSDWLKVKNINFMADLNDDTLEGLLQKSSSDVVLTSQFIYKLNPDCNVLTGTLYVTVYPNSSKIKQMVKADDPLKTPVLKFHVSASEVLPKGGKDINENCQAWASKGGFYLKNALDKVMTQVFANLSIVLKNPNSSLED